LIVDKAFDDNLYVYIAGRIGEKTIFYRWFALKVFDNFNDAEWFEKKDWYLQAKMRK